MLVLIFLLGEIREPWPPLWVMESAARVLLGAWLFALGASVGSFLNVVIYRLPRGMSLAHPGSHCPGCGHAIRGRDNIPLASWLLLGGKCRDCKTPISPRYYYVELIVGLTFLLVAVFEAFLPRQTWLGSEIIRRPLHWQETLPFWSAYATHVVLLTTLLGAALIDRDGWRPPWRMFVPAMLLALVSGALWPAARPIAAIAGLAGPTWQVGLTDAVAGLAAGAACGVLFGLAWLGGSRGHTWPRSAPIMVLATVGIVLGWQRVLILAPLAAALLAMLVIGLRVLRSRGVVALAGVVAVLSAWIAVEWAGVLMPLVLHLASDPLKGMGVSAITTAAGAILAGTLAPAEYHAVQSALPAPASKPADQAAQTAAPTSAPNLSSIEPPAP